MLGRTGEPDAAAAGPALGFSVYKLLHRCTLHCVALRGNALLCVATCSSVAPCSTVLRLCNLQDIAGFLLTRGDYAWLGHGWLGCSRTYQVVQGWEGGTRSYGWSVCLFAPSCVPYSVPSFIPESPRTGQVPEQIHWDYGVPRGLCKETAPNSGVFTRDWTRASISLDCNTWTPTIKLK